MTETQFRAEMRYQVAIAMAKTLVDKGLLTVYSKDDVRVRFKDGTEMKA